MNEGINLAKADYTLFTRNHPFPPVIASNTPYPSLPLCSNDLFK